MNYLDEKFGYVENNLVLAFQKGPLSQWYGAFKDQNSDFIFEGVKFNCTEQWMMAQKAILFDDEESYNEIMFTSNPKIQKRIGRHISNFDQSHWDMFKKDIVFHGNLLKFSQNEDLRSFLIGTQGLTLVEAAPWDRIWGCGTDLDDSRTFNPNEWQGENLLGKSLEKVRSVLSYHGVNKIEFGVNR